MNYRVNNILSKFSLMAVMLFLSISCSSTNISDFDENRIPDMDELVEYDVANKYDINEIQSNVIYPNLDIEGRVFVSTLIGKNGEVVKTVVRNSTSALLENAAVEAIKKSTFGPAKKNGKKCYSWLLIPITFKMR